MRFFIDFIKFWCDEKNVSILASTLLKSTVSCLNEWKASADLIPRDSNNFHASNCSPHLLVSAAAYMYLISRSETCYPFTLTLSCITRCHHSRTSLDFLVLLFPYSSAMWGALIVAWLKWVKVKLACFLDLELIRKRLSAYKYKSGAMSLTCLGLVVKCVECPFASSCLLITASRTHFSMPMPFSPITSFPTQCIVSTISLTFLHLTSLHSSISSSSSSIFAAS